MNEESNAGVTGGNRNYFLPVSILAAALIIAGAIVYAVGKKNSPPVETLKDNQLPAINHGNAGGLPQLSARDVILGNPKAPVTLIEYGDYQCPFCGRFFEQVEGKLRDEYIKTGKVRMIFRNFSFLGPESDAAAKAAECAKDQGKFWSYHDAIYAAEVKDGRENNGNLTPSLFAKLAENVGMNVQSFNACFNSGKYAGVALQDKDAASAVGVDSTPIVFINSQMIRGALPYEQFKSAIESQLKG